MNKFINLREGKFPIKMSLDISYLKNDVDFTNLKKGHAELLISKLSMDLFSCKGEIIILFNDKCQSCLKETVVNLTINSNVIIKDSDILLEDIDRPDETHFQKLKFFEIEKLILEEISLNYPSLIRCEDQNCLKLEDAFVEEKIQPFKKIRDLLD